LPVSKASDWYSVGEMLFQALTGRLPFSGNYFEVIMANRAAIHQRHWNWRLRLRRISTTFSSRCCDDFLKTDPAAGKYCAAWLQQGRAGAGFGGQPRGGLGLDAVHWTR
jgi:serine/threonine protein kinase